MKKESKLKDLEFSNDNIYIEFVKLWSPREYNFASDKLVIDMHKQGQCKLIPYILLDSELNGLLKQKIDDMTTYVSGYIPFYKVDDIIINKDDMLTRLCLEVLMVIMESEMVTRENETNIDFGDLDNFHEGYEVVINESERV